MERIGIIASLGILLLALSACGHVAPAATEASLSPVPTKAAASVSAPAPSALIESTASAAPTPVPAASQQPVLTPATAATTATAAPTTTPKASVASAAPKPAVAAPVAPAAAPKASPVVPAVTPKVQESDARAKVIFKDNCMACHGASLEGDFGPNLTKVGSRLSKEQITAQITNGGKSMPALGKKLNAAEIETLAVWLAAMK